MFITLEMLFKLQNIYVEADEISSISSIRKYSGSLFFVIEMKNKVQHEISWSIVNNYDSEDVLIHKMETLRREIVMFKNQTDTIAELGRAISLKKEQAPVLRMAKKAAK